MFIWCSIFRPEIGIDVFACWWQKCQKSDREKVEEGHVMKEPDIKDLHNRIITRKWLVK